MSIRSTFRKREAAKKPQKKQAPGRFTIGRLFAVGILLAGVYVGLGYLSSLPTFTVETISLSGNNVLVAADITPVVQEHMDGYSIWPYKKDSIFVFQKRKIREDLYQTFGRLQDVSFKKRGTSEVEVIIEEKEGQYMWCGEVTSLGNHENCYILDGQGALFDTAPQVSGDAYFKIYGGSVESESPIGSKVFSLDDFNTIIRIKTELTKHDLDPVALLLHSDGLIEFIKKTEGKDLYNGARVKFTLLADYKTSVDNLLSALNSEPLKTEFAEKGELLQYIDVRFDNRVYYKFDD
jgi:hypothetical protein